MDQSGYWPPLWAKAKSRHIINRPTKYGSIAADKSTQLLKLLLLLLHVALHCTQPECFCEWVCVPQKRRSLLRLHDRKKNCAISPQFTFMPQISIIFQKISFMLARSPLYYLVSLSIQTRLFAQWLTFLRKWTKQIFLQCSPKLDWCPNKFHHILRAFKFKVRL